MAEAAGVGVTLNRGDTATLFGEDQARYLVACSSDAAKKLVAAAEQASVSIAVIGSFGGDAIKFGENTAPLVELAQTFRSTFAASIA